jgi:hypothetical protein
LRLSISGTKVTVKQTVSLASGKNKVSLASFWIGGGTLVGTFGEYTGFWSYPKGGGSTKLLNYGGSPQGVTVSSPGH